MENLSKEEIKILREDLYYGNLDRTILSKLHQLIIMNNFRTNGIEKNPYLYFDRSNPNKREIKFDNNKFSTAKKLSGQTHQINTHTTKEQIFTNLDQLNKTAKERRQYYKNNTKTNLFEFFSTQLNEEQITNYKQAIENFISEQQLIKIIPIQHNSKEKTDIYINNARNFIYEERKKGFKIIQDAIKYKQLSINNPKTAQEISDAEKFNEAKEKLKDLYEENTLFAYPDISDFILEGEQSHEINFIKEKMRFSRDSIFTILGKLIDYINTPEKFETEGPITKEGMQYLAELFFKAGESFFVQTGVPLHKVFHDGSFRYLFTKDIDDNPKVFHLKHYLNALFYLSSKNIPNVKNDSIEGYTERYRKRKQFANFLLSLDKLYIIDENKEREVHNEIATIVKEVIAQTNSDNRVGEDRFKSQQAILDKVGKQGYIIPDKIGTRGKYLGDPKNIDEILKGIDIFIAAFKKVREKFFYKIDGSIKIDRKGNILPEEYYVNKDNIKETLLWALRKDFPEEKFEEKGNATNTSDVDLEKMIDLYKEITGKKLGKGLKEGYQIATSTKKGGNGEYSDVKTQMLLLIQTESKEPIKVGWEHSMIYPQSNDNGLMNHNILRLERKILSRAMDKSDELLGPTISLKSIIKFTEEAITEMSAEIEQKIATNHKLREDEKFRTIEITSLDGDKKNLSLKGLTYRTPNNKNRFDEIICYIINYFISRNKILYFNNDENEIHIKFIDKKRIYDDARTEKIRFLTFSTLESITESELAKFSATIYMGAKNTMDGKFRKVELSELGALFQLADTYKRMKKNKPQNSLTPPSTTPQ